METLKFKTNIKCGGCIATVTPHLNALTDLKEWQVDTNAADKVLTATGESSDLKEQIIKTLEKAGYTAESI